MSSTAAPRTTEPAVEDRSLRRDGAAPMLRSGTGRTLLGIVRILLGLEFLWAFFDKLIGLGFSTPSERAWINGGSPVGGFLGNVVDPATGNPFAGFFRFWLDIAPITNWVFMLGLLGAGLTLTLGIGMRVGATGAAIMMLMMWLASFPISANPFIDYHIIDAFLLLALAVIGADRWLGLGTPWRRAVRGNPVLI